MLGISGVYSFQLQATVRAASSTWFALRDMSIQDLRAVYRFVNYLGPAGEAAPGYVPPDQEPKGPFVLFPQAPK